MENRLETLKVSVASGGSNPTQQHLVSFRAKLRGLRYRTDRVQFPARPLLLPRISKNVVWVRSVNGCTRGVRSREDRVQLPTNLL